VTEDTNALYQAALAKAGSAWQYYKLVVTQFPSHPEQVDAPLEGVPFPGAGGALADGSFVSVANATMETYFQGGTSCMECHQGAKNYGVAFVFSLGRALEKAPPPARMMMAREIVRDNRRPPPPTPGEAGELRHRVRVIESDRDVLAPILLRVTAPPGPERAATSGAQAIAPPAAPGVPAPPGQAIDFVRDIRPIFKLAIVRWKAQNLNCPPQIIERHGKAFGWAREDEPWASWEVLRVARFSPEGPPGSGPLLVDPAANTVRDMLLIRVLRGPGEGLAKGQRMPLGGPYLTEEELDKVERFLSQQFGDKPIHP
jgi:mono/diheme cytochrome c family protein